MASYTLDTGKKYIKEIFASDSFYNIPEYQRPYVWRDDQVLSLVEDISKAMEHDRKKEYFIGCMIWNTKKQLDTDVEYTYQDILDGQQRFITLYLLQGVLRDISSNSNLKKKVAQRIRQEEDLFDGIPERNRIEFEIRPDSEFLEEFILTENGTDRLTDLTSISDNSNEETSVRNMANAIVVLRKWWQRKESSTPDFQKYVNRFFVFLSSQVLALYLATPDNLDDAYNLFTVLNSRGLQLQVSDILRAQNLRLIKDKKVRKTYAKRFGEFENTVDLPYQSFDDFLWATVFIKMKYRSDDNKSLNKAFDFMYGRGLLRKGKDTFDFIGRYVEHYQSLFNDSIHSPDFGNYFINLNHILSTTFGNRYVAPLMHYRECFGEYRIVDFLIKIDNLFSASWLTGKRNLQTRIFIILRKMDEISRAHANEHDAADQFLLNEVLHYDYQDPAASTVIDIGELFQLFDQEIWGSFSGSRINKTRYVLLKLDLMTSDLNNRLYFDRSKSSVEHLMPRKPKNGEWEVEEDDFKRWLHRLGNLVLLDRKKNTTLSNSSYEAKRDKYGSAFENRANTNYVLMNYLSWNADTIQHNHKRVLEMLKQYYIGSNLQTLKKIQMQNEKSKLPI